MFVEELVEKELEVKGEGEDVCTGSGQNIKYSIRF